MSTSASRRMRSARNAMAEALGLGEAHPLRDLPVLAAPPVAAFGAIARIGIEDSERDTVYRLEVVGAAANPRAPTGTGNGEAVGIETAPMAEDVTFRVEATRPNGRAAVLLGTAQVRVGLDASLPVALVDAGPPPMTIDHNAAVTVEIERSQEGVSYVLVARPSPDPAAPDSVAAMAKDIALSDPGGTGGTGGAIRIASTGLRDDTVIRVRAVKTFAGSPPRPRQTTLLAAALPVFVRADPLVAVAAKPQVIAHGTPAAIILTKAAAGVTYALYAKRIADSEFSRADPPDPAILAVTVPGGEVRVTTPPQSAIWVMPRGYEPIGTPAVGTGAALTMPLPPLLRDTAFIVEARKQHGEGATAFTSGEQLAQAAAILVRPDPAPPLRLVASVVDDKLVQLTALAGEEGVFYALAAAAPLGELYLHQHDPFDRAFNKGVDALAISVDFVVSGGAVSRATGEAPPPAPFLDTAPLALPLELGVLARRATTGLIQELGKATVAPLPVAEVEPAAVAPRGSVKVTIAQPVAGERYALMVNGVRVAEPVVGGAAALELDSGPLPGGAQLALWVGAGDDAGAIRIERQAMLDVTVG